LANKFNVCKPTTSLQKRRNQELLLGDGLINIMSQGNDPSCTESEICNVNGLCRFMVQQVEEMRLNKRVNGSENNIELDVLAKIAQKQNRFLYDQPTRNIVEGKDEQEYQIKTEKLTLLQEFQQKDDDCVDVNFDDMVAFFASEKIEPSGTRSWIWQTCTEFGFYQTCDDNCPFAPHFHPIGMDLEICSRLFNITSDNVYENVQASLDLYGGKTFLESGASNILTVNGDVDPWSVLGLEESDSTNYLLPVKMVEGASHHFWTHAVKDTDAVEIIKIREYIYSCVMRWLEIDHSRKNRNSVNSNRGDGEEASIPISSSVYLRRV